MKKRIFGIGETVLDLIIKDMHPQALKAGGSVLNALVSLARCNHDVYFISEIGRDKAGDMAIDFLTKNGINTQYINRFKNGQTPLAMAVLNEKNDAEYEFYKNYPSERKLIAPTIFTENDIVLFGSFYAINPDIRELVVKIVKCAKDAGSTIIYDPNFRKSHQNNKDLQLAVERNMSLATVVRASDEDVLNLFKIKDVDIIFDKLKHLCSNIIITANAKGVYHFSNISNNHYLTPTIKPISTIGAGDNFNAGIIHTLSNMSSFNANELENTWASLILNGIIFASEVCMSYDNYVSEEFGKAHSINNTTT